MDELQALGEVTPVVRAITSIIQFSKGHDELFGRLGIGWSRYTLKSGRAIGVMDFRRVAPGRQRPNCRRGIAKRQALGGPCTHGCLCCNAHKEHLRTLLS